MKEIIGNMWDICSNYDAICVTTNGIVKKDGTAVMGKGIALEFRNRYPELPRRLAERLKACGNTTQLFTFESNIKIISFPTKHDWRNDSDILLIKKSCKELVEMADNFGLGSVLLPRPGCSNGGLSWDYVKQNIEPLLDDRFTIISL